VSQTNNIITGNRDITVLIGISFVQVNIVVPTPVTSRQ
jgi:hypothetical protein